MMKTLKSKLKKIYDCVHSHKALWVFMVAIITASSTNQDVGHTLSTDPLFIVIDGTETVPFPAPMQGSSGFVPSIDDWYGVEISLTMDPNPKK